MKFLHLADLHLGKRVNEISMIEDQEYILKEILDIIDKNKIEAVIMAGDIYDKTVPIAEAVVLLNNFLNQLAKRKLYTFIISGNHDSQERMGFGSELLSFSKVFVSKPFMGTSEKIEIEDRYGKINIFMLPFIKPAFVKKYYKEEEITTYNDAMKVVMKHTKIDNNQRNIIISHQFVTGSLRSDSESISVGGIDEIDVDNYIKFDYVALGHIHRPQKILRDTLCYAGSPLKYSFSEATQKKAAVIFEMKEKGNIKIEKVPFVPKRDMRIVKGTYEEISSEDFELLNKKDYVQVVLTNEEEVTDAIGKLRDIYPNIMKITYDNTRTRNNNNISQIEKIEGKSELELFEEFFELQNNKEISKKQRTFMIDLIDRIKGEE